MNATKDRGAVRAGQHIQAARDARRWSQSDLADAITLALQGQGRVSQTTVSSWELGESVPNRKKWPAIEKALDLEPGELGRFYMTAALSEASDRRSAVGAIESAVLSAVASDRMLDREARDLLCAMYRRLVED